MALEKKVKDLEETVRTLNKRKKRPQDDLPKREREVFGGLGKRYSLIVSLWLHDQEKAFTVEEDPRYRSKDRYVKKHMLQGQLRDLKAFVLESLHGRFSDEGFRNKVFIHVQHSRLIINYI